MDTSPVPPQKKGLGGLAWLGIGCGALLIIIVIVGFIAVTVVGPKLGPKFKQFAEDAQKNPARAAASAAVTFSGGLLELVAEDDVNKRYTVREKQTGKMTTFYWDAAKGKPKSVPGDFSAIPKSANLPPSPSATPAPQ